jgi:hypothetical protein
MMFRNTTSTDPIMKLLVVSVNDHDYGLLLISKIRVVLSKRMFETMYLMMKFKYVML